jgi:hypothetical protein
MLTVLAGAAPSARAQAGAAGELYHVQFAKAAPGKLMALIEGELKAPPTPGESEAPVIFRHVQGDDWQLMTISPLGPSTTIRVEPPNPALEQYVSQMRTASMRHGDTITEGPPWAEARKVLLGDEAPDAVWVVSTFEPLPGHRDQLLAALRQGPNAASSLVLQHREGAPWQVLTITRYASWSALGAAMQQSSPSTSAASPGVSEHIAAHHDTILQRVTGTPR